MLLTASILQGSQTPAGKYIGMGLDCVNRTDTGIWNPRHHAGEE